MGAALWKRFRELHCEVPELGMSLDVSRMGFDRAYLNSMAEATSRAFAAMRALEAGAIANPDENRMVGHYWLRAPDLAPTPEIAAEIRRVVASIQEFAAGVHAGTIAPPYLSRDRFLRTLVIGIGGSALGPMLASDALGDPERDRMAMSFLDNTDPDGIDRVLRTIGAEGLGETLCLVISKSGNTPETRNGMLVAEAAFLEAGLDFPAHAVAITGPGSNLDRHAEERGWLARFPMWDWVGGRTSQTSVVGLLPAALQGLDVEQFLLGASDCDEATRVEDVSRNPAALMALAWHHATGGRGEKDMVVLPYKDRLLLLSRYLQQLVMESLGKRLDRAGNRVDQGLTVYGNKGSTDQHAYVQQLRDGVANFFAMFVRVLEDGGSEAVSALEVESGGVTCGDYLHGFLLGTREALEGNDRRSMTLTLPRVDARSLGATIALFERAVGLYAELIGINAYHQPGVEAGKKAAAAVLDAQRRILEALEAVNFPQTADQIALAIGAPEEAETVYLTLERLAANGRALVVSKKGPGETLFGRI